MKYCDLSIGSNVAHEPNISPNTNQCLHHSYRSYFLWNILKSAESPSFLCCVQTWRRGRSLCVGLSHRWRARRLTHTGSLKWVIRDIIRIMYFSVKTVQAALHNTFFQLYLASDKTKNIVCFTGFQVVHLSLKEKYRFNLLRGFHAWFYFFIPAGNRLRGQLLEEKDWSGDQRVSQVEDLLQEEGGHSLFTNTF